MNTQELANTIEVLLKQVAYYEGKYRWALKENAEGFILKSIRTQIQFLCEEIARLEKLLSQQ